MKKLILLALAVIAQASLFAQPYFPDGTKWTEIRLDTLKYDSWYSKVGDEWVPNFETIEYRVQGEYGGEGNPYSNDPYKCVYTNSSEWTDSLTLLISEGELNGFPTGILVTVYDNEIDQPLVPSSYPFEWEVGTMIRFKDILAANMTALFPRDLFDFGVVEEIKEAYFGGVRLLKYSDVKGVRMIQGIGVVTWNDGECIFGPLKPYDALPLPHEESRHYRSMLVHFERNGEVLYDVWPRKGSTVEVAIDGLNYFLYLDTHEAVIITNRTCSGELDIPSEVTYEGETFVVKSMTWSAFHNNPELTKVKIPKTIESIRHSYPADPDDEDPPTGMVNPIYVNPFKGCTALESVEVDEENPSLKSVDGVLFSQDGVGQYYYRTGSYSGTGLYCYPEGARQESYTIPENVEWIAGAACANNQYLTVLTIPNSTKHICYDAFSGCSNLADVYCKAENVPVAWDGAFRDAPIASATLHVPAGSIDKYKTTSPWSEFGNIVALSPDLTQIRIKDRPGETLEYIGKIGSDFDTALDSLRILKTISSDIEKEPLEVIFDYDNRLFFGIIYGDCAMYSDVLDTKGNYYLRTWYSSDETSDPVTFTAGQMATIILPSAPDASKGKYYRLDRVDGKQIVFEQELQPRARVPYIIVPSEDFSIDPGALDLEGLQTDTVSIGGISFIGSYVRKALPQRGSGEGADSFYIDIIDTTPDCTPLPGEEQGERLFIGALRAYLLVSWSDPYNPGGTRGPNDKLGIVLRDDPNGMIEIENGKFNNQSEGEVVNGQWSNGKCYDLSGRKIVNRKSSNSKSPRGIYIIDGKKKVK